MCQGKSFPPKAKDEALQLGPAFPIQRAGAGQIQQGAQALHNGQNCFLLHDRCRDLALPPAEQSDEAA